MLALFGKQAHKFSIDLDVLQDPTLLVEQSGKITACNAAMTRALGWESNELVGESVHVLIPLRIISKKAHDQKMQAYKYGSKSNFIGYDKILPLKDHKEGERLFRVQIVPVQKSKSLTYIAFLKQVSFDTLVLNAGTLIKDFETALRELPRDYRFAAPLPDNVENACIRLAREYINSDLLMLSNLLAANFHIPQLMEYAQQLIASPSSPHLKKLNLCICRHSDPVTFINLVCVRLLFPVVHANNPQIRTPLKKIFETIYKGACAAVGSVATTGPTELVEFSFSVLSSSSNQVSEVENL